MPLIPIATEIDVPDDVVPLLCETLRCTPATLAAALARFAPAALGEYIDMFVGAAALATATDIRERRLVGLMMTAYPAGPPAADEIARLFNITPSTARSLMRSTAAKHRLRLRDRINPALRAILAACQGNGNASRTVVIHNPVLVEVLNALLEASPEPKTPVRRAGDKLTKYTVDPGSYAYLDAAIP